MKKGRIFGRGEWIRTTGLLVPNQALYQAEPRPETMCSLLNCRCNLEYSIRSRRYCFCGGSSLKLMVTSLRVS